MADSVLNLIYGLLFGSILAKVTNKCDFLLPFFMTPSTPVVRRSTHVVCGGSTLAQKRAGRFIEKVIRRVTLSNFRKKLGKRQRPIFHPFFSPTEEDTTLDMTPGSYFDPALFGIMGGLVLMFIVMCVVLQLFAK